MSNYKDPAHNHLTRDVKPPGVCPGCDRIHSHYNNKVGTVDVEELTPSESRELFDRRARSLFGLSGPEFIRRYQAGEFDEDEETFEHSALVELVTLLPFAQQPDSET